MEKGQRGREEGGGVMVVAKSRVKITKVAYGQEKVCVKVRRNDEEYIKERTVYVSQRTNKWPVDKHEKVARM